jgi:endonuclease/exonuclease/phosphatase (EEP) superfamily protein YafD
MNKTPPPRAARQLLFERGMDVVLAILAAAVVLATAVPLLRLDAWWVRSLDFPRVQIFTLGAIVLAACLLRAPWSAPEAALVAALLLALAWQVRCIAPFTPLLPKEVRDGSARAGDAQLAVLVANVLMENRSAEGLLRQIRARQPDVVLTLEPDDWWEKRLSELDADYPHSVRQPQANRYGMLLQSRLPLEDASVRFLVDPEIPSIHARVRLASGARCRLHCLHPEPPSPTEGDSSTERDAELLVVAREVREHREPAVVAGDLNDVAWSRTTALFQKISRLLEPRKGRGLYNSFDARRPWLRFPVDHVFHSADFELLELARLEAFGSDHFPILVRLVHHPPARASQEAPAPGPGDFAEADEKVAKAAAPERNAAGS